MYNACLAPSSAVFGRTDHVVGFPCKGLGGVGVKMGGGDGGGDVSARLRIDSRLGRQLRRELVHRLASAPCTHSELQETCYATAHSETVDSEVMDGANVVLCFVPDAWGEVFTVSGWLGGWV